MGLAHHKVTGRGGLTLLLLFSGRLSQGSNAFYASLVNHIAGFIVLSVVVLFYLPQFPVTLTTILAICGQVLSGFITDIIQNGMPSHLPMQIIGVILLLPAIGVRYRTSFFLFRCSAKCFLCASVMIGRIA